MNFEANEIAKNIFINEHDIPTICQRLSILYATPVIPGKTLLFLDEIQSCPEALKSLWFFKENMQNLHVVAAGSLLEFAIRKMPSYGVGRVSSMFMYPMAFNEFLSAIGKDAWVEALRDASPQAPLFAPLHKELVSAYRTFLLTGGMPASVAAWVATKDYNVCQSELSDIQQTYYDDFAKYSENIDPVVLRHTLQSVIEQTGQKFVYSKVKGETAIKEVKKALELLEEAGLIKSVRHTAANGMPLGAEVNEKFTKYIYLDSGLLLRVLDLDFGGADPVNELILAGTEENLVNKGKLAELSVGWELVKAAPFRSRYELFYWENLAKGTSSEVDYVIPRDMEILPIEVKAGTSGKMKSLRLFMEKKKLSQAVRTSLENFGLLSFDAENSHSEISIIPIYAIGRLTR